MSKIDPKVIEMIRLLRPSLSEAGVESPSLMSREDFLVLQSLEEQFDLDHAQGHDFLGEGDVQAQGRAFRDVQKAVSDLMDASSWVLHPDHGCVSAEDVDRLDAGDTHERFTVKRVSGSGEVLGRQEFAEPGDAMRAYSVLRHSRFGLELDAGAYVALVDEQSQFDASYLHEGRRCFREQFAKQAGSELARQVLREDLIAPERQVEVQTATLAYERLDWAVAKSMGFKISEGDPMWALGDQRYGVAGRDVTGFPLFQPSGKPELAQWLMEVEGIGVREIGEGHWTAMAQDQSCVVNGPDMLTAGLRAIVMRHSGEKVAVPSVLPATVHPSEPLVDSVIRERVAAHYTDYFRGPVSCLPEWDDDGVLAKNKFNISGGLLPAHAGSPSGPPNTWSMADVIRRSEAVAIAKAHPQVRAERDSRALALLGICLAGEGESQASRDARQAMQTGLAPHSGEKPDLKLWATIEWKAACELLQGKGYTPEVVAQAMSQVSPACVLPQERQNLDTWLSSAVESRKAVEGLPKLAPETLLAVGP